jgi:hypothetical protein
MELMKKLLALATSCILCASASAACYTVLAKDGKAIYQSDTTPVNLSYPLHETVPVRFGEGATMVFSIETRSSDCVPIGVRKESDVARGDNVMSTVFANVRSLDRPPANSVSPAKTIQPNSLPGNAPLGR